MRDRTLQAFVRGPYLADTVEYHGIMSSLKKSHFLIVPPYSAVSGGMETVAGGRESESGTRAEA